MSNFWKYRGIFFGTALLFLLGGFVGVSLINPVEVNFGIRNNVSDFVIVYGIASLFSAAFLWFIGRKQEDRKNIWLYGAASVLLLILLSPLWS